jgi:threonine dehydrogenase-like Zn-dependent dehydrogenase
MNNRKIVFESPWQVDAIEEDFIKQNLNEQEVLVRKIYSLISPGTELAMLSGKESWAYLPTTPSYASVSEIVERGEGVNQFNLGDIVFSLR